MARESSRAEISSASSGSSCLPRTSASSSSAAATRSSLEVAGAAAQARPRILAGADRHRRSQRAREQLRRERLEVGKLALLDPGRVRLAEEDRSRVHVAERDRKIEERRARLALERARSQLVPEEEVRAVRGAEEREQRQGDAARRRDRLDGRAAEPDAREAQEAQLLRARGLAALCALGRGGRGLRLQPLGGDQVRRLRLERPVARPQIVLAQEQPRRLHREVALDRLHRTRPRGRERVQHQLQLLGGQRTLWIAQPRQRLAQRHEDQERALRLGQLDEVLGELGTPDGQQQRQAELAEVADRSGKGGQRDRRARRIGSEPRARGEEALAQGGDVAGLVGAAEVEGEGFPAQVVAAVEQERRAAALADSDLQLAVALEPGDDRAGVQLAAAGDSSNVGPSEERRQRPKRRNSGAPRTGSMTTPLSLMHEIQTRVARSRQGPIHRATLGPRPAGSG